jgi:hypothetical protein
MCAYQVERLLTNRKMAEDLSKQAREVAVTRNDQILERQLKIYQAVLQLATRQAA